MTATLNGTRRQAQTGRLADLEAEVAALRRELAALRDALAVEVRTKRVVVTDGGDREVLIMPGTVSVACEAAATVAFIEADWEHAVVAAWSSDEFFVVPGEERGDEVHRSAELVASNYLDEPRRAFIELDDVRRQLQGDRGR